VVILLWLAEEVQQQCDFVACILASEISFCQLLT
jgi:hypothetical protein